jgi:hypothetical protein
MEDTSVKSLVIVEVAG